MMSLTEVLSLFFMALTIFLSATAGVFLHVPVQYILLGAPVYSFFFRTLKNGFTGYGKCLCNSSD